MSKQLSIKTAAVALAVFSLYGCNISTISSETNVSKPKTADKTDDKHLVAQQPLPFVLEALLDADPLTAGMNLHKKNTFPLFIGENKEKKVALNEPTILVFGNARLIYGYKCYQAENLTIERKDNTLIVDGEFKQYGFKWYKCTEELLHDYVFSNTHISNTLNLGETSYEDKSTEKSVNGEDLILESYLKGLADKFGPSWALIQKPMLAAAINKGEDVFTVNPDTGYVSVKTGTSVTEGIINYKDLDSASLLSATLWDDMPGQGVANSNWCNIVNIPDDKSIESLKAQTVIATNCARSRARYCDGNPGSISPAAPPVAWDDSTAANAQLNSDVSWKKDATTHYEVHSSGQNVFGLKSTNVILPTIGYTSPRDDGHKNDAGKNSWAGHKGHCQNVMNKRHTRVGIGFRVSKDDPSKFGYWTQDFN